MIPLTTLYDDYIDRPKLSEQKKNPFDYIVPPPLKWVGTIFLKKLYILTIAKMDCCSCVDYCVFVTKDYSHTKSSKCFST